MGGWRVGDDVIFRDTIDLAKYYFDLFGLTDRVIRKGLPVKAYAALRPILWGVIRQVESLGLKQTILGIGKPLSEQDIEWFRERFPDVPKTKTAAADRILKYEFDFLGTGPTYWGEQIDWHQDVKSGYKWPVRLWPQYQREQNPEGVDIKVPWELSRFHHLVTLGQAWQLTKKTEYAEEVIAQWKHWRKANPWLHGVNWANGMEVSIRAVNLVWATSLISKSPAWKNEQERLLTQTLREHGKYIEHNLEISFRQGEPIAGNHYIANLSGLATIGLTQPNLPESSRWRRIACKALENEIRRQVLADGFFFESSTAYHRFAFELFLIPWLLTRESKVCLSAEYERRLEQMLEVILHLTRPDGCVPQIGDNDDGRLLILSDYPDWRRHDYRYLLALGAVLFNRPDFKQSGGECSEAVYWLLGREGVENFDNLEVLALVPRSQSFEAAGLHVIRGVDGDYALVRTGTPSSSVPVAHAHNDAMSIELWVAGQPVFVDRGSACYTSDIGQRNMWRSTASHNTVVIDGEEQNELSKGDIFSLGRNATIRLILWEITKESTNLSAEVSTNRKNGTIRHLRSVEYDANSRGWRIEDTFEGAGQHHAKWYWHFAPGYKPTFDAHVALIENVRILWDEGSMARCAYRPVLHASSYGRTSEANVLSREMIWHDKMSEKTIIEPLATQANSANLEEEADGKP